MGMRAYVLLSVNGGRMDNCDIVLFSAYARLPGGTVSGEIYGVMALVVLIDVRTGLITDAECTLSTRMAERFVHQLLVGRNLETDCEAMIANLNEVYQGSAKKTIITTLRVVADKYQAYKRQLKQVKNE